MPFAASEKLSTVAPLRLGDALAAQPLSGITNMDSTKAVHGMGRAGFVREEEKKIAKKA